MAGAAIGVSHLVQSTRAGADYGLQLLFLVVLVNLLKLPFFEIGHRYALGTGESLVAGYRRLGKGWLYAFFGLNLVSGVGSIAGVTIFTAALAQYVFGWHVDNVLMSGIILLVCFGIIAIGHYGTLDLVIKVIMSALFLATFAAVAVALGHGPAAPLDANPLVGLEKVSLGFLVALMGWMPAPIEISVWQSLWMGAKAKAEKQRMSAAECRFDFWVGFGSCIVLAVAFVTLGAFVMHGTGIELAASGVAFSQQLIELYTTTLGSWAGPFIMAAALAAMFSTTLTVFDGYPRSLAAVVTEAFPKLAPRQRTIHWIWMLLQGAAGLYVIGSFGREQFTELIDLVTSIAFLAAPFFAALNLRLVWNKDAPASIRPGKLFLSWSVIGLVFFAVVAAIFVASWF